MFLDYPCYDDRIIDGDPDSDMDPLDAVVIDTRRTVMADSADLNVEPITLGELLDRYEYEVGRSTGYQDPPARIALDKKPRLE